MILLLVWLMLLELGCFIRLLIISDEGGCERGIGVVNIGVSRDPVNVVVVRDIINIRGEVFAMAGTLRRIVGRCDYYLCYSWNTVDTSRGTVFVLIVSIY